MSKQTTIFMTKEEARLRFWETMVEMQKTPWWRPLRAMELEGRALEIVVNNDLV